MGSKGFATRITERRERPRIQDPMGLHSSKWELPKIKSLNIDPKIVGLLLQGHHKRTPNLQKQPS